jgi:uncharacterized membrane protein YdbT with pleckstrin-like domain
LWCGKPANLIAKAKAAVNENLNATEYKATNQRIIITGGVLGKKETEADLKHVKDLKVKQSLLQRASGIGDIIIISTDPTEKDFILEDVPDVVTVKEIIRKAYMDYRANMNIVYREDI